MNDVIDSLRPTESSIDQSDVQVMLGHIALRRRDAEQARDWFTRSLDLAPGNALALAGLARSHALDDRHDKAEEAFKLALEADPDEPIVLVDYATFALDRASSGDAWFTADDYVDKARKLLLKAKRISPPSVEIDTQLAVTYLHRDRDPMQASRLLAEVVRRSPSDQLPVLLLAQLYQREGLDDEAIAMAELLLRADHRENSRTKAARKVIAQIRGNDQGSGKQLPKIAAPAPPASPVSP